MKKLAIAAALLLTASTAQAGQNYSFEIGGRTIRIHAPRGCDSPSCISLSIPGLYDPGRKDFDDDSSDAQDTPQAAARPAAHAQATAPAPLSATAAPAAPAVVTPAPVQQATTPAAVPPPTAAAVPAVQPGVTAPPVREQTHTAVVAAVAPATEPVQAPSPAAEPVGPLGVWLTEKKEGHVRIEECGTNLCGYSVDSRTGRNKEKVLINMKPAGTKWSGKIYDPKSGSTYSSTIAMKGNDRLRVRGCAFGGMFCGGQTWSRLN
ncbi:MAG: hypothetical protein NTAFB05_13190 [Nitrobacter sp.]|uniref:DUF2147 domain-containing protein n=1 Tax=Nitrobacter sp. TaxID=29420 RepID=UPI00387DEEB7